MKRQRRMLVLLGVLVICIGAAAIISNINFEEKMVGTETEIVNVDSSEITALSWNYEESVSFTYEDEEWKYTEDENMPVNQELLGEIAENLASITSDKMVEEPQALSVYGLDDPAYTLTVGTADETVEISIGNESFTDGEVYISTGDGYVYLTDSSLIDEISYSLYDLVQTDEIPEMETVTEISIDKDEAADIVYQEDSGYGYSDAYTYYLKDGEEYRNLDNENTETLFSTLSAFSWEECADYYAEDSELASYGLDAPDAVVTVSYEDEDGEAQQFAYEVASADGSYYGRVQDSTVVCSISQDVYDAAVNASYDELKPDEIILLDWDTVDSIDVEIDGNTYTVEIVHGGEDEEDTYTLNGEEVEFGDVLDDLPAMTRADDDELEEAGLEDPEAGDNTLEMSLTFHRNTEEYDTVELDFYQYNGTYCIAVLNGDESNYVSRESVVSLQEAVNTIVLDQ